MKRALMTLLVAGAGCSFACSGVTGNKPGSDSPAHGTDESASPSAIANPASTHCLEVGGKLEIRESAAGQTGVCIFADGSRCEEWRLMRGECARGQCRSDDGLCLSD